MVNRKKTTTKAQAAAKSARKESVKKDVAELGSEKIASSIAKSSVEISKRLAEINETAQEEVNKLNTIREAIGFKEEELSELHGKEQVLKSIDELQLEAENSRIELESQIEERRTQWTKEQIQHDQAVADRDAKLARDRQREQDEYSYKVEQERKEADNQWNDQLYQRQLHEQRRIDALQQTWADKEKELAAREAEVKKSEDIIANFDKTLAEAKEQAAKEAKASVYAETANKTKFLEKDYESKAALQEQKILNLEAAVADYKHQVVSLEDQNSNARDKIQEMARAALEASSGKAALDAVQKTVEKTTQNKR